MRRFHRLLRLGTRHLPVRLRSLVWLAAVASTPLRATGPSPADWGAAAQPTPPAHTDIADASQQADSLAGTTTVLVLDVRAVFDAQAAFSVSARPTQEEEATRALDEAHGVYRSVYTTLDAARETSEIARLNRAAGGGLMNVSPSFFALLRELREVAMLSGGAFDPTDAPLRVALAPTTRESLSFAESSSSSLLETAKALVSYESLHLDAPTRQVGLKRTGQSIQLGRIASAMALNAAAGALRASGFAHFALRAGSEVFVAGQHEGRPWRVGVQDPGAAGYFAVLEGIEGHV
ncbi:MAG: FAD:protein FMN transferase, partial [Myxococcota bacterium]